MDEVEAKDQGHPPSSVPDANVNETGQTPPSNWLAQRFEAFKGVLIEKNAFYLPLLVLAVWLSTAVYKVAPDEQGVVLRFGQWIETTGPGLHVHLPWPVDKVIFPKITQISQTQLGDRNTSSPMLTGDENIVEADCAVSWQIADAGKFLFRISDPNITLKITGESALREVISRMPIQSALSDKRAQIADETTQLLQKLLDEQDSGIRVLQVQLQRIDPPVAVVDAFNDVQRARADQERARNEAQAYANDILPRAKGDAARMAQEALAYKEQTLNKARSEALSFAAVRGAYKAAPEIAGWKLYMDSLDGLLKGASKVLIATSGGSLNPIMPYLPLDDARGAAK